MEKYEEFETQAIDKLTPGPDFLHSLQDYLLFDIEVLLLPAFI